MAHAYTPGLKVAAFTKVTKRRRLPLPGEILVETGQLVRPDTAVARASLPGNPVPVNLAHLLNVEVDEVMNALVKQPGDAVKKGELLALHKAFFGLFKSEVVSPVEGVVEAVSAVTGQMTLREPSKPVEIKAYMAGRVTEVVPREGAVIEATGALVQGIFGVGGETHGTVRVLSATAADVLEADQIHPEHKGMVLVGGALVTGAAIEKARAVGAAAVVVGGVIDRDLIAVLGYDIGVAITGQEELGLTIVLTEGFGRITMAARTFRLLQQLEGREASLSGATQIRAGVMRPEIIVPLTEPLGGLAPEVDASGEMLPGTPIRVIRDPFFGMIATVAELPPELQQIETEARVRVLVARLSDGRLVTIPRANAEIIEG